MYIKIATSNRNDEYMTWGCFFRDVVYFYVHYLDVHNRKPVSECDKKKIIKKDVHYLFVWFYIAPYCTMQ